MHLPPFAFVLTLALLAAGCAAPADVLEPHTDPAASAPSAPADAVDVAAGTRARTRAFSGAIDASAGAAAPCAADACLHQQVCLDETCANGARFELDVEQSASALLVELKWEGPFDLDLHAYPDAAALYADVGGPHLPERPAFRDVDGAPGAPDSIARILVDDPGLFEKEEGWRAIVQAKGAAAQVPFELRVTTFFGGAPPEGWSAFEQDVA